MNCPDGLDDVPAHIEYDVWRAGVVREFEEVGIQQDMVPLIHLDGVNRGRGENRAGGKGKQDVARGKGRGSMERSMTICSAFSYLESGVRGLVAHHSTKRHSLMFWSIFKEN